MGPKELIDSARLYFEEVKKDRNGMINFFIDKMIDRARARSDEDAVRLFH